MSGTKGGWGKGDAAEKAVAEVKLKAGTEAELSKGFHDQHPAAVAVRSVGSRPAAQARR